MLLLTLALFLAVIAGMVVPSWNGRSYMVMVLGSTGVCGLYLFAEGLW